MRAKWRCLTTIHYTFGKNQTDLWCYGVKHGGGGVMIWVCSAATRPGHLVVIFIAKYSSVKCEAICLEAKACLK